MAKKKYQHPFIITRIIYPSRILAGSTGASGEDAPWGAKTNNFIDWSCEDEESNNY